VFNFTFQNPTKILFGKGQIANITSEIPKNAKVLMTYGEGSIKNNGVYDQAKSALAHYTLFEFAGIEPNPEYDTLMQAVKIVQHENIDFLLAVGGGSVADGTKFIAAASLYAGHPWEILASGKPLSKALPLGVVLTLPATGTEMNGNCVVSHSAINEKRALRSPLIYPQFSVLDPEATYSVPLKQIGNGIVDSFVHVVEQYLTYPSQAPLQDRFAESIMQTLIEVGPITYHNPHDYDARSSFMWCTTMALNGLIGVGVPQDWSTHIMGYELTISYGLDHAQTLAVLLPSVMHVKRQQKQEKLLQYGERVFGITQGSIESRIDHAISKTREFFESVGVPTRLSAYNITAAAIPQFLQQLEEHGRFPLGEHRDMDRAAVQRVFENSL